MRFHAVGDVALALPACNAFRLNYPDARIDLLTSPETAPLARAIELFDEVHLVRHRENKVHECRELLASAVQLRRQEYQMVIDLQRNWKSRWIRRSLRPTAWAEFDRFTPLPACERTLTTFREAGYPTLRLSFDLRVTRQSLREAESLLLERGWHPGNTLVLLNPAGLWKTRNWPIQNYVAVARDWPMPENTRFLLVGTERLRPASQVLIGELGHRLIDLTERTSLDTAFALLKFIDVAVTEDSGLMHMAWSMGRPLVALFGSSRHFWSLPTGERVHAFHSGDLSCAACMDAVCRYGDVRCLTRVSPAAVLEAALKLLLVRQMERSTP